MAYIGSLAWRSLGANGSTLLAPNCDPMLASYLNQRFLAVQALLRGARDRLAKGGGATRQVLKSNFLDGSPKIRTQVLARVAEALRLVGRVVAGEIVVNCSDAPDCCTGGHPACIVSELGRDRLFVCVPSFRTQRGIPGQEQILLHELFHRAGLRGPAMHAVQFADMDCARGADESDLRALQRQGVDLLEVVDLHVRTVWCLGTGP